MPIKDTWIHLCPRVVNEYIEKHLDSVDHWLYRPVRTKADFVKRYQNHEFGNHSPSWDTFDEFDWHTRECYPTSADATNSPKYHLRNRVVGGLTFYNISAYQAFVLWAQTEDKSQWYCSAMAPLHLLNGELMRTHEGLVLFYSTVQKPMRDSLKEGGREAKGLTAKLILQYYMNQRSYDWTMLLLDRYKAHVIEFTVVDRCWGTVPGFNTLFWEVRRDY